ncbi:HpcH/HpaI aldolase/citrate lyase family protein [Rummeliibacillus sp. JY-2-4R]
MNITYLFVPGCKERIIYKAIDSSADTIVIDLEDAVALSEKETARNLVSKILEKNNIKKEHIIRINGLDTTFWKDDLDIAIRHGVNGIMIPKVEDANIIEIVCEYLESKQVKKDFYLIPLIETAKGVHFAYEIAKSHERIQRLAFGSIDYYLDIECEPSKNGEALIYPKSHLVISSKVANIGGPIDTVFTDLSDEEGLVNETKLAKRLGFHAKLLIHPKQIASVHQVFTPTNEKLLKANEIVKFFEKNEGNGEASLKLDDQFIDYPVYKKAKQLVERFALKEIR